MGGTWFALTWLETLANDENKLWRTLVTYCVAAGSISLGFWGLLARETLPIMIADGKFSTFAIVINFIGGVLFVLAAARFLIDFNYSARPETYFLACLAILFGITGVNFLSSTLWDVTWWFWHIQRLLAYFMVLGFVVYKYIHEASERKRLELEKEKHLIELDDTN